MSDRSSFETLLVARVRAVQRDGKSLALAVIDLRHLKRVNDQFGHSVGDQLLALVGEALRQAVREGDIVARIAGSEFAVLLPDTDVADAAEMGEVLCETIVSREWPGAAPPITLSASIGIAVGVANSTWTGEQLRDCADAKLRQAYCSGRPCVFVGTVGSREPPPTF